MVPRMSKGSRILGYVAGVLVVGLAITFYLLFRGYFDTGKFEIKQVQWSTSKQVAVVAERSDRQALGGLTYFVLIGSHLFTPVELRHAYHSNAVVFATANNCLTLRWKSLNRLVVSCSGAYLDQEYIDVEKRQWRSVAVSYVNISPDTAQTLRPK